MAAELAHKPFVKRVGIALACFEPKPEYFREQLASIAEQSFTKWSCFISSDSPLGPLKGEPSLRPFFEDSRFIWSENTARLGVKKNFERVIQVASRSGVDAIACSDQDDQWYPRKLEKCVDALNRVGRLSLVHSDLDEMGSDGALVASGRKSSVWKRERRGIHRVSASELLIRNVVAGCAMVFDAELARLFPTIPDTFDYHDHWYAVVAAFYSGVHPIHEPLLAYRQHPQNTLGVTPFRGTLARANGTHHKLISGSIQRWLKTQSLATGSLAELLTLSPWSRWSLLNPIEPGLGLFFHGMRGFLTGDPALARAAWARSFGKLLCFIGLRPKDAPPAPDLQLGKELRGMANRTGKNVLFRLDRWNSQLRHAHSRVTDLKLGQVGVGSRRSLCLFAHFSRKNEIAPYVVRYLRELHECGFETVFSSTSECLSADWPKIEQYCSLAMTRENRGLDFGSWKIALDELTKRNPLDRYEELLFANDSVFGPFRPLAETLQGFRQRPETYLGITDSFQKRYHVQSYFLFLKRSAFLSPEFKRFWQDFLFLGSKTHIIEKYEISFSRAAYRAGCQVGSLVSYRDLQRTPSMRVLAGRWPNMALNATHHFWKETLVDFRSPFLKKELLVKNPEALEITDWERTAKELGNYPTELVTRELRPPSAK